MSNTYLFDGRTYVLQGDLTNVTVKTKFVEEIKGRSADFMYGFFDEEGRKIKSKRPDWNFSPLSFDDINEGDSIAVDITPDMKTKNEFYVYNTFPIGESGEIDGPEQILAAYKSELLDAIDQVFKGLTKDLGD